MVTPAFNVADVTQAIQLALGPVFLLTAIAGLLNVMTGRLARIIDRGRQITGEPGAEVQRELHSLEQRRHIASGAITSCVLAALLVCMVIVSLFLEVVVGASLKWLVALFFISATVALVVGLSYFLHEVRMATYTVRIPVPPRISPP
jgi:Flp pilus assembly protein TadB